MLSPMVVRQQSVKIDQLDEVKNKLNRLLLRSEILEQVDVCHRFIFLLVLISMSAIIQFIRLFKMPDILVKLLAISCLFLNVLELLVFSGQLNMPTGYLNSRRPFCGVMKPGSMEIVIQKHM